MELLNNKQLTMMKDVANDTITSVNIENGIGKEAVEYFSTHEIIIGPLLLLVIIYSLKYFFGNKFNEKSLLEFALEFPVDFGFIGITFVFTYSFLDLHTVIFGKLMILVCIIVAIFNSTLRRLAISEYEKETSNNMTLGFYGILNFSISILFVYFILNTIQN